MDWTETKIIKLKGYLNFIKKKKKKKINNLSDFQKSERPITRTSRNSTRHYSNSKN